MDILLRELRDGPGGIPAYQDTEFSSKQISIGCAADQQIQLFGRAVAANHAVIRPSVGRWTLSCFGGLRATVNGKEKSSARLKIGDRIEIGGHQLTIAEGPAGFDLAIELRANTKIDSADFEAAFRTDLQQTWLGKRWPAWALITLTGLCGLVIPLIGVKMRAGDRLLPPALPGWLTSLLPASLSVHLPKPPAARVTAPISAREAAATAKPVPGWLPSDALWSTGPLGPGHRQVIGERCSACHQTLFTKVQDGACRDCHKNPDHVEATQLAQTTLGPVQRCAACHHEHDEPMGHLVDRTDKLCVDCHADSAHKFGSLKVQAVNGFGTGRHPSFASVERLLDAGAGAGAGGARPGSGLKFSHPQHLDADRVRKGDRNPLGCRDCHKLQNDGEHFEPTTMANNCSTCHELTFDPDAPDRQLPHGKPRDVVRTLQDYFARKFSDPTASIKPASTRRRLPGREEEETTCKGPAFACAMQKATSELESQFLRRGCVSCHQVSDSKSRDLVARFNVVPIHLVNDFYPAARFPHRSHLIQDKVAGDAACLSCHPVRASQTTGDVLLPEMATCERCHSDMTVRDRTRLQCVSCHAYHPHS